MEKKIAWNITNILERCNGFRMSILHKLIDKSSETAASKLADTW